MSISIKGILRATALVMTLGVLAACTPQGGSMNYAKGGADANVPQRLKAEMAKQNMPITSPVMARVFKEENKVELWKQKANGKYGLLASYEICKYSGKLGPKYLEGDRQAPEGFYSVSPASMNPNSKYHLSFDIGYPNKFDRVNHRTGANLMVHGACSSSGCYSMNDGPITEIYAVARESFKGGQRSFQIQAYPFRMTAQNMSRYSNDMNYPFWKNLKEGYDAFEATKTPPSVDVCDKRYVFNRDAGSGNGSQACPGGAKIADVAFQTDDTKQTAALAAMPSGGKSAPPMPSIQGLKEANLVTDWTKRRARGERITMDPPVMNPDGTVTATSRMGRATNEAGKRMAALEAEEAKKKREAEEKAAAIAEAKRLKEEAKAQAVAAKAAKKAAKDGAVAAVDPAAAPSAETTAATAPTPATGPAPAQEDSVVDSARKRLGKMFGG